MKYRSLRGDYGAFSGKLEFSDGLNVVYAENESGKSTVCAFIRAMFYGVSTSEREKSDHLPDKLKYQPWSGRPMNGSLVLSKDGRDMVITRSSDRGAPMRDFSAVWSDTHEPVAGLNGSNAGEELFGVSSDVFSKTAFCSAEIPAVKNSAELEARIASAAGSGDEDVSPSAADARLAAWQRERKNGKRGTVPMLEEKISGLKAEIEELEEKNGKILSAAAEISSLRAKKDILEKELEKAAGRQKKNDSASAAARGEYCRLCAEIDSFITENRLDGPRGDAEKVSAAEKALRTSAGLEAELRVRESELYRDKAGFAAEELPKELEVFRGCSPEYAVSVAKRESEKCRELLNSGPKFWLFALGLLLLASGALILALLDASQPGVLFPAGVCFAGAAAVTVLGITGTVSSVRGRRRAEEILSRWGCNSPDRFSDIARAYEVFCRGREKNIDELAERSAALSDLQDKLAFRQRSAEQYVSELGLDPEDPLRDVSLLMARLSDLERLRARCERAEAALMVSEAPDDGKAVPSVEQLRSAYTALCRRLKDTELSLERMRGEAGNFPDLAQLKSELSSAEEELSEKNSEYAAISLARELLAACSEEFSRELTPKIAARAEEIFTRLTSGRYGELHLTRDLDASVVPAGEAVARKLLYLSRGASDQAWLSVRLALSETVFGEESVPLVLDDVLAMYDDSRAETALSFLAQEAQKRQIILFTCRRRDAEYAAGLGAAVTGL